MSFILEALRKSENERRLESTPQVMRMPAAVRHSAFPIWAAVVITALTVSLIAVSAVTWWNMRPVTSAPSLNNQSLIERRAVAPRVDAADRDAPELAAASAAPSDQPPGALDIASPAEAPPEQGLQPRDASIATPASAAEASIAQVPAPARQTTFDTDSLPSMSALAAEGMALPPLDLQLHVNSDIAANRFVIINGRRYKEGERLQEGLLLIQIAAAGAVLEIDERQFLLGTK